MKNNLFLKLSFGLSFLLIASTAQANCMWTLNDKCLDIGTTVKWTESAESDCSGMNKLNGTTNKCCCASEIDGCCEKTQGTTVTAVNLTGEKCARISYATTTFFQDRQALNNICVEKSAVSCTWKSITTNLEENSVSGGCSANETLSNINACPSPQPTSGVSNKTYQCCCQSTNVTYVKPAPTPAQPKFIVPELSIAIPGLKSFSSSSIEYIANDDGSFSVSIPWLAQYIKAFYNYGLSIIGILAALVMIAGGILWLISAGNDSKITKAKELIIGSVSGIIIFSASYLILIQINPDLIENKSIILGSVKASIIDLGGDSDSPNVSIDTTKIAAILGVTCGQDSVAEIIDKSYGKATYNQKLRTTTAPDGLVYLDCSSFASFVLKCAKGKTSGQRSADIFSGQIEWDQDVNKLQAGDLIGWTGNNSSHGGHVIIFKGKDSSGNPIFADCNGGGKDIKIPGACINKSMRLSKVLSYADGLTPKGKIYFKRY